MFKKCIICALCFCVAFSCRKNKKINSIPTQTPVTNSPYSISTASVFSGSFNSAIWTKIISSTYTDNGAFSEVYFFNPARPDPNYGIGVSINKLLCTNQSIEFDTVYKGYRNYSAVNFGNEFWQVLGGNGIPSFNYFNSNTPSCNNFNVAPDSISKSSGFTINLTGVVNVTTNGFEIRLSDPLNSDNDIYKPIFNGNSIITFSPAELSAFNLTTGGYNGYIYISLENNQKLNFYGSDFTFSKKNLFSKPIKIIP